MATSFASGTSVSVEKTRGEIEAMLMKVGASSFGTVTHVELRKAVIGFTYKKIQIEMHVGLPDPKGREFTKEKRRSWIDNPESKRLELYSAEVRRRWRCLALAIKAKLISVEDGVTTFETEFLPYMVMPNGQTFAQNMMPAIEAAKESGLIRPDMLALPGGAN